MRIEPLTNSTTCIITVPRHHDREWLIEKLSRQHCRITTCPVYLFSLLCESLDHDNEKTTSAVLSTFEKQEKDMEKSCREVQVSVAADRDGRHPGENRMYEEHRNAIIQLNRLNMNLMTLGCTTDFELSALSFAKSVMARYIKLCSASNRPNNLPRVSDDERQDFNDEIESLQTATRLRQTTRTYAQDRAEHMVSLLSAHNTQRDVVNSQAISENSRKTSSQARNLTMLGSLFIPPTFVATLFGADIFTVNPKTGNVEVKPALGWILGASAGGLTLLVLLVILFVCNRPKPRSRHSESCCPLSGFSKDATTLEKKCPSAEERMESDSLLLPTISRSDHRSILPNIYQYQNAIPQPIYHRQQQHR